MHVTIRAWFCAVALTNAALSQAPAQAPTINLQDALARARQYGAQIQSASLAVLLAKEDRAQARAARLPSVNAFNQFIYTEANGTPSGVFIANDGVHVYNEQAIVHQELLSLLRRGELNRAAAIAMRDGPAAGLELIDKILGMGELEDYYPAHAARGELTAAQMASKPPTNAHGHQRLAIPGSRRRSRNQPR